MQKQKKKKMAAVVWLLLVEKKKMKKRGDVWEERGKRGLGLGFWIGGLRFISQLEI